MTLNNKNKTLQLRNLCGDCKLTVKRQVKRQCCVFWGGNSAWSWQPFLPSLKSFPCSAQKAALALRGATDAVLSRAPSPSHLSSQAHFSNGWVKGADVEPGYFDRRLIFSSLPCPSPKLFLFPYGLFLLSTKSKEEQQGNYSGRVGETPGRKSTKRKPQRFSILRMGRDQSTMSCLSVPGGMIKGREREGDVNFFFFFLKISWYRIHFKEIPDPLDGKNNLTENLIMNVKPPGNR